MNPEAFPGHNKTNLTNLCKICTNNNKLLRNQDFLQLLIFQCYLLRGKCAACPFTSQTSNYRPDQSERNLASNSGNNVTLPTILFHWYPKLQSSKDHRRTSFDLLYSLIVTSLFLLFEGGKCSCNGSFTITESHKVRNLHVNKLIISRHIRIWSLCC